MTSRTEISASWPQPASSSVFCDPSFGQDERVGCLSLDRLAEGPASTSCALRPMLCVLCPVPSVLVALAHMSVSVFLWREPPSSGSFAFVWVVSLRRLQFIYLVVGFPLFTAVYALLVRQHVLYGILMHAARGRATLLIYVDVYSFLALWRLLCLFCRAARPLRIKYMRPLTSTVSQIASALTNLNAPTRKGLGLPTESAQPTRASQGLDCKQTQLVCKHIGTFICVFEFP